MTRMLTRWEPFRDLSTLQDRIDRLFQDTLGRNRGDFAGEGLEGAAWAPAVDILEKGDDLVLRADLPGVDPKDVEINVQNGTLTLKGERKWESDVKEDDFRRVERVYGSFVRSFSLPTTVDADKVEVKLPKRPEAKPKQIKVAVK
jgi:HSP20 family protein